MHVATKKYKEKSDRNVTTDISVVVFANVIESKRYFEFVNN